MTAGRDGARRWAGKQGGAGGVLRIMVPNAAQSEHDAPGEISWDEFFRQFDESKLAPRHHPPA